MHGLPVRALTAAFALAALVACGDDSPTSPGSIITAVQIGISGSASAELAPGETRQLFATASQNDGTIIDVTNAATWQSSNPSLATVTASGLLSAAAEGAVDVTATYNNVRGTLRVDVRRTVCEVTVAPASTSFNAFGGTGNVTVTVSHSACRWTARSDVAWFRFTFDQGRPGDGAFGYTLPPNSTPDRRAGGIIVESSTGQQALHAINQDRPAGCSYVADPGELTFTAAGGTGQFRVITTPSDCRWNAVNTLDSLGVFITSGFSGRGNGTVRYIVQAHTRTIDADGFIEIAGLSGANPNGRHRVVLPKR